MFLPSYLATRENKTEQKVAVIDRSTIFLGNLEDSKSTKFVFLPVDQYQSVKDNLKGNEYYALLEVPENILITNRVFVFSHKQVNIDVKNHIESQLRKKLEDQKLGELVSRIGIPDLDEQVKQTKARVSVDTIKLGEDGTTKKGSTEVAMILGYVVGFMIYMFVFIYGGMVMRGVLEEKQSRIVEVIISSVKPIQLMIGKILGLAAVGLTQMVIWVVLMIAIFTGLKTFFISDESLEKMSQVQTESIMMSGNSEMTQIIQSTQEQGQAEKIFEMIQGINFTEIILAFVIYFILGYLLYSSLMAAIASAVDNEEDMNQFMMPITIPLIAAIIIMMNVMKNPEGALAVWASHIPLTSPIIMMVRIPFGVPWWEILISMAILALST
jgi:ABC-2 type transport system permease protein